MGQVISREIEHKKPTDVLNFRKSEEPLDFLVIPELPQKREVTDLKFTIVFIITLLFLGLFLIIASIQSDTSRFWRGFDDCGNVCGKNNFRVDGIPCSGKDQTNLPFTKFVQSKYNFDELSTSFQCADRCDPDNLIILNRCFPTESHSSSAFITKVVSDIQNSSGYIVGLCFLGLFFSVGMLILFRYFVDAVVWIILIGSMFGFIAYTGVLWYWTSLYDDSIFLKLAIVFTIISIGLVVMLICMFKRIKLVIRLFKEAIQTVFGIPLILFEPLLTVIAGSILLIVFAMILLVLSTVGTLQQVSMEKYEYIPSAVTIFTICLHALVCLWFSQFIIGCQHMVISGAVSSYYFTRNKSVMVSPIYTSFYNLIRYHLGTVAFGSLVITIVIIIRMILKSLAKNKLLKVLVDCCMGALESFIKFLSKNAYIQTAMHGQPFYKSGKRAVRLLYENAMSTIAINSVGHFVLFMAKLLVVLCTVTIGILMMKDSGIQYYGFPIAIISVVTIVVVDSLFAVFETAIDTIFLCFCEDNLLNNGTDRPFYMTVNLRQYIEDAKN